MTPKHQLRYEEIQNQPILVCKYIYLFTLDTLDMFDSVFNYFNAINWKLYVDIWCGTFYEFVYEFYETFSITFFIEIVFSDPAHIAIHQIE